MRTAQQGQEACGWNSPGTDWEWLSLQYTALLPALTLASQGRGLAQEQIKGGFWVGFPTQVQEEEQTPTSCQAALGPALASSHHWVQDRYMPSCAFVCVWLLAVS